MPVKIKQIPTYMDRWSVIGIAFIIMLLFVNIVLSVVIWNHTRHHTEDHRMMMRHGRDNDRRDNDRRDDDDRRCRDNDM